MGDLEGLRVSQISVPLLTYIYRIAMLNADHYPERLFRVFIINSPTGVGFVFRNIRRWLDKKTDKKLSVFGGPDTWRGPLQECMDLRILPVQLGGETVLSLAGICPTA